MNSELKPCPFCGGKAKGYWSSDVNWFYVICKCCGAKTRPLPFWDTAMALWNKRANDINIENMEDDGK